MSKNPGNVESSSDYVLVGSRPGRIYCIQGSKTCVQFGADGPFEWHEDAELTSITEAEFMRLMK